MGGCADAALCDWATGMMKVEVRTTNTDAMRNIVLHPGAVAADLAVSQIIA
jgi:hypothetical protein